MRSASNRAPVKPARTSEPAQRNMPDSHFEEALDPAQRELGADRRNKQPAEFRHDTDRLRRYFCDDAGQVSKRNRHREHRNSASNQSHQCRIESFSLGRQGDDDGYRPRDLQ